MRPRGRRDSNFLRLAEEAGWEALFLGPCHPHRRLCSQPRRDRDAALVGVSYRLTPETGERLLAEFAEAADDLRLAGVRFAFGGTPPVGAAGPALHVRFSTPSSTAGRVPKTCWPICASEATAGGTDSAPAYPQTLVERIAFKSPYPLLRHHFGLPTWTESIAGVAEESPTPACST